MYNIVRLIIMFAIFSSLISCTNPNGLIRTPYDCFETVTLEAIGVQISLPENSTLHSSNYYMKIYDSEAYQKNTNSISVVIQMHPYWFVGSTAEPEYFLIIRLNKAKSGDIIIDPYKRFIRIGLLDLKGLMDNYDDIDAWIGLDQYSGREYYILQKEIVLPYNNIIYVSAKLFHRPDINTKENDDVYVIRKIFNSIEPM